MRKMRTTQPEGAASRTTMTDAAKATILVAALLACVIVGGIIGSHVPPLVLVVGGLLVLVIGLMALVRS